jgi:chorismate mutase
MSSFRKKNSAALLFKAAKIIKTASSAGGVNSNNIEFIKTRKTDIENMQNLLQRFRKYVIFPPVHICIREANTMQSNKRLYIVEEEVLPEVALKVLAAKEKLEAGKIKTVSEAAAEAGVSRSAFYKYKDSVLPFYENISGKTLTFSFNLENTPGLLSNVLNLISAAGANVLTINQTIPINNTANVTLTIETRQMTEDTQKLFERITQLNGTSALKVIARE